MKYTFRWNYNVVSVEVYGNNVGFEVLQASLLDPSWTLFMDVSHQEPLIAAANHETDKRCDIPKYI